MQVHEVCRLVAQRSAVLVAGALHAIMQHSSWTENPRHIVVTFDGGVYEQFAGYRAMLRKSMVGLLGALQGGQSVGTLCAGTLGLEAGGCFDRLKRVTC